MDEMNEAPLASTDGSASKPKGKPPAVKQAAAAWADAKGHMPKKVSANAFRGARIHRGPHFAVIAQHMRGKGLDLSDPRVVFTEGEYDALVHEAYNIAVGESPAKGG